MKVLTQAQEEPAGDNPARPPKNEPDPAAEEDIYDDTVPQTDTVPPPRPPKAEDSSPDEDIYDDTVPQPETEELYDDTVPQSIPQQVPQKVSNEKVTLEEDGPDDFLPPPPSEILQKDLQEDQDYAIAETKQDESQAEEEYEVLPDSQEQEQSDDMYDTIIPTQITQHAPAVPRTPVQRTPSNESDQINYTLPVKVSDIKGIIKAGWLGKHKKEGQFSLINKFQKRYCVLVEHALYYYKKETDKSQKGQIILPGYQIIYPPKQVQGTKKLDQCFELNGENKRKFQVIQFMASTKEDAADWTQHIQQQLNRNVSKRQSVKFQDMEKKSQETDKDNSESGSEEGSSLCGGEEDDMHAMPIDEDLYEPIPGSQQIPSFIAAPTLPSAPIPAIPPSLPPSFPPTLPPSLPPRRPESGKPEPEHVQDQTKPEEQEDEDFYDDVGTAQDAIPEDIYDDVDSAQMAAAAPVSVPDIQPKELHADEADDIYDDTVPSPVTSDEPAPLPARPPKPGTKESTEEAKEDQVKSPLIGNGVDPTDVYVALWNCSADGEDELEFNRGDFIHVVNKVSSDWWIGKTMNLQQIVGLLPSAYVQEAYYL